MSTFAGTYNTSYAEIQPELLAGESLLWAGQPRLKVIFHSQDGFMVPFSFVWGGFTLFAAWNTFHGPKFGTDSIFFLVIPGFLALVGQYMIWGRFFYTAWRKGRTHYGVTNKRVIVLNEGSTRKITDRYFANLDSVSLSVRNDGIGTIELSPAAAYNPGFWSGGRRRNNQMDIDLSQPVFYDIEDARSVYELVQAQRQKRASSEGSFAGPE
jgi:hypothetical protein